MADAACPQAKLKEIARRKWLWIGLCLCIPVVAISCVVGGFLLLVKHTLFSSGRDATIADYGAIRTYMNENMAHFPASIPAEATGVRFVAYGFFESFPTPDKSAELRYILPLSATKALCESVEQSAVHTETNEETGFTIYVFQVEYQSRHRSVKVNPATGEVIYYALR